MCCPMSLKPVENRHLTAVNRPVNWAFNRSGYCSFVRFYYLIFFHFEVHKYFFTLRKLTDLSRNHASFIFLSALNPLVPATSAIFA